MGEGRLDRLEGLELNRLDLVLLLGRAGELEDTIEVGGGEHLLEGAPGRVIASSTQGDGRVVTDVAVVVALEPLTERLGGVIGFEEAQRVDGNLPELGL